MRNDPVTSRSMTRFASHRFAYVWTAGSCVTSQAGFVLMSRNKFLILFMEGKGLYDATGKRFEENAVGLRVPVTTRPDGKGTLPRFMPEYGTE